MRLAVVFLAVAIPTLAADLNGVCDTLPRQHVEERKTGQFEYAISMAGAIDGESTRDPVGYWGFDQFWEPNLYVRVENTGDVPVVNPWLRRQDMPDLRSLASIAASVVAPSMSEAEKARRLWECEIANRFHASTDDTEVQDAVKRFNAYGYGLCYDASKTLSDLWRAAGLKVRQGFPNGHSTAEVFYDGAWHLLDSDESIICLLRDNRTIASEAQIVADHDLMKRTHTYGPLHDDDRLRDESGAALHFYEGERSGEQPSLTRHRMDFTLRPGEALTWSWNRGGRYHGKDFVCCGGRSDVWRNRWRLLEHVRNGELRYAPDLRKPATDQYVEMRGWERRPAGPFGAGLYLTGPAGALTVPVNSAWPVVGGTLTLDFNRADTAREQLTVSVSFDGGKTWREAGTTFQSNYARLVLDLNGMFPSQEEARYSYLLRVEATSQSARPLLCVKGLELRSTLQMAELALPGLRLGENSFVYSDQSGPDARVRVTHAWRECPAAEVPGQPGAAVYPPDGGTAEGTRVHFRWQPPAGGAADYEFQLSEYPDLRWALSSNFRKLVQRTADRGTASYRLPYAGLLNPGQTYYWRVRARSAEGVWGAWSKVFSFSALAPAVPANVAARFDQAARTVRLSWEPGQGGTGAVRYRVYGSDERGFSVSLAPYRFDAGKQGLRAAPANLLLETEGRSAEVPVELWRPYYRVAALDSAGRESGPSDQAELRHPLLRTRALPQAQAGAHYQVRLESSFSIGHLVSADVDGKPYDMDLRGGDDPVYAVTGGPKGLDLDQRTGLLAGFLGPGQAGRYELAVSVAAQGKASRDEVKLVLEVRPPARRGAPASR